jgi:hypothetical protein
LSKGWPSIIGAKPPHYWLTIAEKNSCGLVLIVSMCGIGLTGFDFIYHFVHFCNLAKKEIENK